MGVVKLKFDAEKEAKDRHKSGIFDAGKLIAASKPKKKKETK